MRILTLGTLALALGGALPARAADPDADLKRQVERLQQRVDELEKARKAEAPAGPTAEQQQELDRTTVKTEALEDWRDAAGLKGFKISGYLDPTYVYNAAKERGTFQFLVPAASDGYGYDDSYFGTVSLDIVKETEGGTKFHLNLVPKRGTGDFNEESIVNEASVWIPLGSLSRKLFAGQIPDWSGYEYQSPVQNLLVTHNLLFDFTLPYFYTGAGLELVSPRLDLKLMVANYNTSIRALGEHVPAFVFRGDHSPKGTDYWGFGFAGAAGYKNNARARDEDGNPVLLTDGTPVSTRDTPFFTAEVDGWYARGKVTLNGQVSFGTQRKAAITADPDTGELRDAQWWGASALAAYRVTPTLQAVARADFIYDRKNGGGLLDWTVPDAANGVGPDQKGGDPSRGASKYAVAVGLNYAFNPNVTFKAEYRFDGATENVFGKNQDAFEGGPEPVYGRENSLVATQVVMFF